MTRPVRSILFIELLGGIGDLLIALPAIQALARSHPGAGLDVLTFAPGSELLLHDPLVAEVVVAPKGGARAAVDRILAERRYDVIVSDTMYEGIDARIAASGARTVVNLWRSPPPDERVGERFVRILLEEGLVVQEAVQPASIALRDDELEHARRESAGLPRPLVALLPDAGMQVKCWPVECFIGLARELRARFGAGIVVPADADATRAQAVVAGIGDGARLLEFGPVRALAAALAQADLVVAADTGPARIAARVGVPTVTLFGPSWQGRYGEPAPHATLQAYPKCGERDVADFTRQACWYAGTCPLDRFERTCLEEIGVGAAVEAAARVLGRGSAARAVEAWGGAPASNSAHFSGRIHSGSGRSRPAGEPARWRRILIVRLDNIGDVVMTGPALRALSAAAPEARLTLLASPAGAKAAALLPWVDEVIERRVLWQALDGPERADPAAEWALVEDLERRGFDAALILTSFSQTPHAAAFVCRLAGIPVRAGESGENAGGTLTHAAVPSPVELHQVDRNARLVEALGIPVRERRLEIEVPERARAAAAGLLARLGIDSGAPYLLLNPWTSAEARTYEPGRFARAARELAERTGWPVVLTGVERDRAASAPLLDVIGPWARDAVGATTLPELAALLDGARLLLTNNTSTMHLSDALATPCVILFAGTELEFQWRPRHTPHRLLRRPTSCSPCYAFTCPYGMECLDIAPEEVVAAGLALLGEVAAGGAGGIATVGAADAGPGSESASARPGARGSPPVSNSAPVPGRIHSDPGHPHTADPAS